MTDFQVQGSRSKGQDSGTGNSQVGTFNPQRALRKVLLPFPDCLSSSEYNRGGALIGAIIALLVVGILGAGVASLISTSSYHEVRANHGERAYYLAESGYRYALSVYRHADSDNKQALMKLKGEPHYPDSGGKFTLKDIRIQGENNSLIFTVDGNQTVDRGDNELAIDPDPYSQPEQYNYAFEINGKQYRYLEYDEERETLKNIRPLSPDVSLPVNFSDGDNATAITSVRLISRGEFPGSGFFNAVREVTYWQPLHPGGGGGGGPSFEGESTFTNDGTSMDDWAEGPGEPGEGNPLGDYESEEIDGNDALQLEDMNPGHGQGQGGGAQPYTSLMYQPEDSSRIEAADYEVQVKIKLGEEEEEERPDHYMAGITFRKQTDQHNPGQLGGYGVSFIRGDQGENLIPDALLPKENTPLVAFWRMDGNPNNDDPVTRLAWTSLADSNIVDSDGILKDWSSLLVRVEEKGEPGSRYNRITLMYGDHARDSESGDSNPMNEVWRLSSLRKPDSEVYGVPWPPDNFNNWFPERDYFTLVEWNEDTGGGANRTETVINDEGRGIRIHTAPGENLFSEGDLEMGLHTWGSNLEGKVWFDDFAVREAATEDGGSFPFVPPIQQ